MLATISANLSEKAVLSYRLGAVEDFRGMQARRLISNDQLKQTDIPGPSASWNEIRDLAYSFNGYEEQGSFERCAEIAKARRSDSLSDLRTCLFFEHRRLNHLGASPGPLDMEYFRSLLAAIRSKVSD